MVCAHDPGSKLSAGTDDTVPYVCTIICFGGFPAIKPLELDPVPVLLLSSPPLTTPWLLGIAGWFIFFMADAGHETILNVTAFLGFLALCVVAMQTTCPSTAGLTVCHGHRSAPEQSRMWHGATKAPSPSFLLSFDGFVTALTFLVAYLGCDPLRGCSVPG